MSVTGFTPVANSGGTVGYAAADGTFANGWRWVFYVTVPTNETVLNMKFDDWTSGTNSISAGSNIQFYSAQSNNAVNEAHAIAITAAGVYSDAMNLNPGTDLDALTMGRQIKITVEARVPVGSAGGSYSTSYGIQSNLDTVDPTITAPANVTVSTDAGLSTATNVTLGTPVTADNVGVALVTNDASTTFPLGDTTVTWTVKDAAGNFAAATQKVTVVDTVAPSTTDNIPSAWQKAPFDVTFTCTDSGSGCAKVYYTTNGSDPDASSAFVTAVDSWKFNVSTDGTYTVKYRGQDISGNLEEVETAANQLKLDQVRPTVVSVDSDGKTFNIADRPSQAVKITFSEDIANIPQVEVHTVSVGETVNNCGDTDAKTFCFDYTILSGSHTIYISGAQDAAGNTMNSDFGHTFNVDTTAPTLTVDGFTANSIAMDGSVSDGYTLNTDGNVGTTYPIQFAAGSVASEALKSETDGLFLIPVDAAQTAALVSYYSTKPAPYLGYLDAAAAGTQPFAYVKTNGTAIRILDGAQYTLSSGTVETDMIVPGDYPVGTYTVSGKIHDLAGNETTVTYILKVKSAQTISFTQPADATYGDASFDLVATGGASGNPVTFAVKSGPATISDKTVTIIGAGDVTITASQAGGDYYFAATDVDQTFNVAKKAITVTPNAGQTKVYGDLDPMLAYTSDKLVGADYFGGTLSRSIGENVGDFTITPGNLSVNSNGDNYVITVAYQTFAITPRPITVTADSMNKEFESTDPALTYKLTSGTLVNPIDLSGNLTRNDGETIDAVYAITQGTLVATTNYALTFVPGILTIVDTTSPVFGATPDITVEALSGGNTVEFSVSADDNVDGRIIPVCTPPSGSLFAIGTTTVNCTATDNHDNVTPASFKVIVQDTTIPVITLTGDNPQTIERTAAYTELGATATDNYDGLVNVSIDASAVNTDIDGTYTVTYNAIDAAGNHAVQATREVDVIDTIAPTATVAPVNDTDKMIVYTFSEAMKITNNDGSAIDGSIADKLAVYTVIGSDYSTITKAPVTIVSADLVGNVLTAHYTGTLVAQINTKYIVDAWGYKISDLAGIKLPLMESEMFTVLADNQEITVSFGEGGSIGSPVKTGTNQKYAIKASSGHYIFDVLVDNVSVIGAGVDRGFEWDNGNIEASYTFFNVEKPHTLSAVFELIPSPPAPTPSATTGTATNITPTDATLNGTNGPVDAIGHSFWVSLASFDTSGPTIPPNVYSTPDFHAIGAGVSFSASLLSITTSGVPINLPAVTPGTTYYFVAWTEVGSTWYPGTIETFTTAAAPVATLASADITSNGSPIGNLISATLATTDSGSCNGTNGGTTVCRILNISNVVVTNGPLSAQEVGFTLQADSSQQSALVAYFAAKDWPTDYNTQIGSEIAGTTPFFYFISDGSGNYSLADGFMKALGQDNQPLSIDDNYLAGTYTYTGKIGSQTITVTLTVTPPTI